MISSRLQQCIETGSVVALFPLLKDWPQSELEALIADIESYYQEATQDIENLYQNKVFLPENFLSRHRSMALDQALDKAQINTIAFCSEIASVALHYLEPR